MTERGEIRTGKVVFIPGKNGGRYPYCNSLYIKEEGGVVIDPASDEEQLQRCKAERGIGIIINTHYHEDHFLYSYLFPEAELWVPEADAPAFESLETLLDYAGFTSEENEELWRHYYLDTFHFVPRKPDRLLHGRETLDFGETQIKVLTAPGHTPGHSGFWFPREEILFLGDYDLTSFGPWYGDKFSSIAETIASVQMLREVPAREFWISHGEPIGAGEAQERFDRYLRVIEKREEKILDLLKSPRDLAEIVQERIIYGKPREPAYFFEFAEKAMIRKHLEDLIRRGLIALRKGKYSR